MNVATMLATVATTISFVFVGFASASPLALNPSRRRPSAARVAPFSLDEWIDARCRPGCWEFRGSLYDPLVGKHVADVRGFEFISNSTSAVPPTTEALLSNPNATFSRSHTMRSCKLFCYTEPKDSAAESKTGGADAGSLDSNEEAQESNEPPSSHPEEFQGSNLLRSLRLRPQSPRKIVPLNQAVVAYETSTTFVVRPEQPEPLIMWSEFPEGNILWASTLPKVDSGVLEYSIYTRRRFRKLNQLPDLTSAPTISDDVAVTATPRSALIQFGSNSQEERHKYGARETYAYSWDSSKLGVAVTSVPWWQPWRRKPPVKPSMSNMSVRYTRYGEAPPFYVPNRMCTLELRGRKIDMDEEPLSPLLAKWADELNVMEDIKDDDSLRSFDIQTPPETMVEQVWHTVHGTAHKLRSMIPTLKIGGD